jgi:hypothetical protein
MKRLKNFFGVLAFVLAFGAAFVSRSATSPPFILGYLENPDPTHCVASDFCADTGTWQCTNIEGKPLYQLSGISGACFAVLRRD